MNKNLSGNTIKRNADTIIQEMLDILKAEDGKSFEEKKKAMIQRLDESKDAFVVDILADLAFAGKTGEQTQKQFWQSGEVLTSDSEIVLRKVAPSDRDGYLELQREYSEMRFMLNDESCCDLLWNEHTRDKTLALSIIRDGVYIGYCAINNTTCEPWEIGIELQPEWTNHGIGGIALTAMLSEIKSRLEITEFRARIEPQNYASQKLIENLGAVPNGISELWLHDQKTIEQCEEDYANSIDDKLIAVAEKFGVEPRKLLSHVLEYKLTWK